MKSLEQVIKQKCKYLPVEYDDEDEYNIRYYLHNRGNDIPNYVHIYRTNDKVISENSVTLLNETKPLLLYIFSCLRTREGEYINKKVIIKLYFKNTNIILYKGSNFTISNELAPLKHIENHLDFLKTAGHYMSFHKSFSLRIYFIDHSDYYNFYNESPHYEEFYAESGDFDYSDNEDNININNTKTFKNNICIICLERIPKVLFCSCGHICICEKCNKIKKIR